jgi:hypothetical protein
VASRRDEPVAGERPAPRPEAAGDDRPQAVAPSHDSALTGVQPMRTSPGAPQDDELAGAELLLRDSATAAVQSLAALSPEAPQDDGSAVEALLHDPAMAGVQLVRVP